MVIIKSRKARTFLRMEIMVEDNDIIWPGSVAKIMSRQDNAGEDNVRPRRTNVHLMSVNRAAALCGPRKPSNGKIGY